jgi:uncharacterized protein (TIGR03086 family)
MRKLPVDPVTMFERAATAAASMVGHVRPDERRGPTLCTEWEVQALLDHMVGGTGYLLSSVGLEVVAVRTDEASYRVALGRCVDALRQEGVLERSCPSPAGFEWPVSQAVAGTAMDQLVHTWDLAVAIGGDRHLDGELVEACVAIFLPEMPNIGRAAGFVGPEVPVPADAPAQDRLLGAMGRRP